MHLDIKVYKSKLSHIQGAISLKIVRWWNWIDTPTSSGLSANTGSNPVLTTS